MRLEPKIATFIDEHIDSIPELEALLLLHETVPKTWDAASLSQRLYIPQEETEFVLLKLRRMSLVIGTESQGYYFNHAAPDAPVVVQLAAAYRSHLSAVTRLVHSKPSAGVREFARSFHIKDRK